MPFARSFRNIFRSETASEFDLRNLDHLEIPQNVPDSKITTRQCVAHLYLLEQFVSAKSKVNKWAEFHQISKSMAWNFYVNMAVERMQRWFSKSYHTDLSQAIPPLDVLMVWHALLQSPRECLSLMEITKFKLRSWNWELLLSMVENAVTGKFEFPDDFDNLIKEMYHFPNLLDAVDSSSTFLQSRRPDKDTDRIVHHYLNEETSHLFAGHNDSVVISFDFRSAINAQLDFANRVLQYSWHRLHPSDQGEGLQLRASIERYHKFMALEHFTSEIQSPGTFRDGVPAFIPTIDIDLVWRTHMLCPKNYRSFSWRVANGILEHTPSPRDFGSFDERTSIFYKHVFGEEYVICLCWPCVHSRDLRSFPPPNWTTKPRFKEELSEEKSRRATLMIELPLRFGTKQCHRCGSHPNRSCKAKGFLGAKKVQIIRPVQLANLPLSNETIARLSKTPWAEISYEVSQYSSSTGSDRIPRPFSSQTAQPGGQKYSGRSPTPHASALNFRCPEIENSSEMLLKSRPAAR